LNKLKGTITKVESTDAISLVDVSVGNDTLSAIVLETPQTSPFIAEGRDVWLIFKETEVSINMDLAARLSLRNRMKSVVKDIEKGKVLTRLVLDYAGNEVVSLITSRSVDRLGIAVGNTVEGLVKANEMLLMETEAGDANHQP
jgi:molybdate transport system regulatory protein